MNLKRKQTSNFYYAIITKFISSIIYFYQYFDMIRTFLSLDDMHQEVHSIFKCYEFCYHLSINNKQSTLFYVIWIFFLKIVLWDFCSRIQIVVHVFLQDIFTNKMTYEFLLTLKIYNLSYFMFEMNSTMINTTTKKTYC